MLPIAEAMPVQARWSEANRQFLEFVERNPEYLDRGSFASIYEDRSLRKYGLQPWPLFIGSEQLRELEEIALGVDRLVKGALERFLRGDPARIMEFYRSSLLEEQDPADYIAISLDEEEIELLVREPNGIRGALSRGDYIETRDGFKLVEFNAGGFLGGLQTQVIAELHLRSPAVSRFLGERGVHARAPATLGPLFRHLVEDTARMGAWQGGEFNVAFQLYPHEEGWSAMHSAEVYTRELRRVLEETGAAPGGRVVLCGAEDLVEDGGAVRMEGCPIHAVIEMHDGSADMSDLVRHFKSRRINLFSGPISAILLDKRNLVLLSENAASDEFSAAERELIEKHIPWTRRLVPSRTTFRGRGIRLPEDVVERRDEFVLKKAISLGGSHVHIGKFRTDAEWRRLVSRALQEEDWVVQEYLETVRYCFQAGESGAARFYLVWGLFAFGDHFGGAFLRMQPAEGGTGVVNAKQGAEVGALLEVVR
ncbi:MAG: hypothetical protein ABW277_09860 [Longimicrobiaceae bacterium]